MTKKNDHLAQAEQYLVKDPQSFASNLAKMAEKASQAASAWSEPLERGEAKDPMSEPMADLAKTLSKVTEYWLSDPSRALEAQTRLFSGYMEVWSNSIQRVSGQEVDDAIRADGRDRRFKDTDWGDNAFFNFLKQAYLITARWAGELVEHADGLDEQTRIKARFYVKQVSDALSPSNFVMTNPELLRETIASNGDNLVKGLGMLAEDIKAGGGDLKLRQVDASGFKVGANIATTPGKVVARSELAEIIQYEPATKKVLKRPLVICPPWINKFYILDLNPEKSFIRWAVSQGHTVFVISWVNPDKRHAEASWEDYIEGGIELALNAAQEVTGEHGFNTIGYCVGGTLLTAALAQMAKTNDKRIKTATLFTTQVDFTHAGDLAVFVDEEQVKAIERSMRDKGYLDGTKMAMAFNMLRSSELIWPYVVNNYIRGKTPTAFDLLYWNSDSTRMTAANHSYYLRNCYLDNNLANDRMVLGDVTLSLSDITIPIYNLAAKEDHIAPAKSVFLGCGYFGGDVEYVMAGSGHIAGVINPPAANKYQYQTGGVPEGDFETWVENAQTHPGSWWTHWHDWIKGHNAKKVDARPAGGSKGVTLGDAPGDYVKIKV